MDVIMPVMKLATFAGSTVRRARPGSQPTREKPAWARERTRGASRT